MKSAWTILLISALTDFIITAATAITSAMVASESATMPGTPIILLAVLGGVVSAARTIQQALKATPEMTATLKGTGDGGK